MKRFADPSGPSPSKRRGAIAEGSGASPDPSRGPVVVPGRLARDRLPPPARRREPLGDALKDRVPAKWLPVLEYHSGLHGRGTHGALPPLERDWVEVGPGYVGGPCFGHWDVMHAALDALEAEPAFARDQILNQIERQKDSGAIPGLLSWDARGEPFVMGGLAPAVWPFVLDDWLARHGPDDALRAKGLDALAKLLRFMERERSVAGGGFFFADARDRVWESGVDEGARFDPDVFGPDPVFSCVDATAQTALHYRIAERWARAGGGEAGPRESADDFARRAEALETFLADHCRDPESGWFFDAPMAADRGKRVLSFEGIWGLFACGRMDAAADRAVDTIVLDEKNLLGAHGLLTVGRHDARFEKRLWRGPSWNSMTYWAARACLRCERPDAARELLRRALDGAAEVFERTGTIWEFYGPDGEDPLVLHRKPDSVLDEPCPDYLGHNPLFAMAALFARIEAAAAAPAGGVDPLREK